MHLRMGMHALTIDTARVRTGRWRGSDELAYLVPLSGASTLTPGALAEIRERLRADGFRAVITAAVAPSERDRLEADGFSRHELLHLLRRDLRLPLPPLPSRHRGIRRGRRIDRPSILRIDAETFEPFWQLDTDGLHEAIRATPTARLRIVRRAGVEGYAITGCAARQGYLQRLAVAPERQGTGLGVALVTDGLHWLRRRGAGVCWVNTQEANQAALSLYRKLGFVSADHRLTVLRRDL